MPHLTLDELRQAREIAVHTHRRWKARINLSDNIAAGDWEIAWPDDAVEPSDPLVENIYSEALEDKVYTAGVVLPRLFVQPAAGTRSDRGERNAQKRRRAIMAMWGAGPPKAMVPSFRNRAASSLNFFFEMSVGEFIGAFFQGMNF